MYWPLLCGGYQISIAYCLFFILCGYRKITSLNAKTIKDCFYSPVLKKWGYTGFTLSVCLSVILPYNILTMNRRNETKFCLQIIIDKIYVGIVKHHFLQVCNRVTVLD